MAFDNLGKVLGKSKYLWTGVIIAVVVSWIYTGTLTRTEMYDSFDWIFAIVFPLLVGGIIMSQIYNSKERKTCPANATTGGAVGGVVGITTVACPICPLVLLSWLGLAGGGSAAFFSSSWLKAVSLVILLVSLNWSTKK